MSKRTVRLPRSTFVAMIEVIRLGAELANSLYGDEDETEQRMLNVAQIAIRQHEPEDDATPVPSRPMRWVCSACRYITYDVRYVIADDEVLTECQACQKIETMEVKS